MSRKWTDYFQERLDQVVAELRTYVEMESPTHGKAAVDAVGALIKERFTALGCTVTVHEQPVQGNQLRLEFGEGEEQILVLGHFDTVKEIGTLTKEPWRIEDGKIYGPGTYDMKAGIVFAYFALQAIVEHQLPLKKKLVFFWNSDEEIGSVSSKLLLQEEARNSALALVVEPSFGDGLLKTSRKGGGEFTLRAYGRAVHAGNDHQKGINAIEELAHHILAIQSWTNYELGTTLSVGTITGGTTSNVVPELAEVVIDVRVAQTAQADVITSRMHALQPVLAGARLEVTGGIDKLPMERTAGTERLLRAAQEQAALEGFAIGEIGVGGTSDGNIASSVGCPVLDGLGPVGDGAHASHEHVLLEAIPRNIALLVRLFTSL